MGKAMTINSTTTPVTAVLFAVFGGRFRIHLTADRGPGHRFGDVLDDTGAVIAFASDVLSHGQAFVVSTSSFAGYVPLDQIDFVTH
jgi:hypothetical protein